MEPILYDHFERIEERHWWWRSRRAIVVKLLERHCPEIEPFRVLDVGCGMGALLAGLPAGMEGYGVDVSEKAVRACRGRGLDRVFQAGAQDRLPFEDGFFHAVLALDLLEHLEDEAPALAEMRRVLRPAGVLIATVPAFGSLWSRWDDLNRHLRRYRKNQLLHVLGSAGFQVAFSSYINFLLFPAMAARVVLEILRGADHTALPLGSALPPARLNRVLEAVFSAESHWLERGCSLPWGSSVLALGRAHGGYPAPGQDGQQNGRG